MQFAAGLSYDADCCKTQSDVITSGVIKCWEAFAWVNYSDFQTDWFSGQFVLFQLECLDLGWLRSYYSALKQ